MNPSKNKILALYPLDHDTNDQACLAATQSMSGKKSEEMEDIDRVSMAPREVEVIRRTDPMVILRSKWGSSRNLLIQFVSYDTFQQREIIPL